MFSTSSIGKPMHNSTLLSESTLLASPDHSTRECRSSSASNTATSKTAQALHKSDADKFSTIQNNTTKSASDNRSSSTQSSGCRNQSPNPRGLFASAESTCAQKVERNQRSFVSPRRLAVARGWGDKVPSAKATSNMNGCSAKKHCIKLATSRSEIDPTIFLKDITRGTSFENDPNMQKHLTNFANAFSDVAETLEGKEMLKSLEAVGRSIKDKQSFTDVIRMVFALAKRVGSSPMVQFGLFLGLMGVTIALVGQFGPAGLAAAGIQQVVRRISMLILTCALTPLYKGTKNAISSFFSDGIFMRQLGQNPSNARGEQRHGSM